MSNKVFFNLKKWLVLFLILLFPYLVVQVIEKSTHNILTLGYVENNILDMDSLGQVHEFIDTLRVPSFKLINQDQNFITNKDLIGFNYIVNFFFTSCPTICPSTTLNLIQLQKKLKEYEIDNFKILSISVDPENDTS